MENRSPGENARTSFVPMRSDAGRPMLRGTESQGPASKRKSTGAHFTPPQLARLVSQRLAAKLEPRPRHGVRILDPACGDGELLRALAESLSRSLRERSVF